MSGRPHTVTIHVDQKESEALRNGSVNGGSGKQGVEMMPMGSNGNVSVSGSAAGPDGIVANMAHTRPSPDAASPGSALYPAGAAFPLSIQNIQRLFDTATKPEQIVSIIRDEYGNVEGLMEKLATDPTGLDAEQVASMGAAVNERIAMYGRNVLPVAEKKTFLDFCKEVLEDTMLRVLMCAAIVSIALGLVEDTKSGWYEGTAIFFAIFLVTVVSAANNFAQQQQFADVDVSKELDPVTVIRSGRQFSMDPTELLVGDLVALSAGQRIPADGVMIQVKGQSLKVNESSATGETGLVEKKLVTAPLLMSGTEVVSGSCVFLVVLVGINTSYGQTLASLVEEDRQTPLQKKLGRVATLVGYIGTTFAALTFISLLGYWISEVAGRTPSTEDWHHLLADAVVCVSIIVVAVPEGLPLAVTVSLAFSMKAMLKDNILVRELSACETMGNATAVCSDKTGTLTQNRMTVLRMHAQGAQQDRILPREDLHPATLRLLEQSIILNSAAWIEEENVKLSVPPQDWAWKDGNQTEVALLSWLISYGFDVNRSRATHAAQIKATESFDSIKKYSSIILEKSPEEMAEEGSGALPFRQYFKGAAEAIIAQTNRQVNAEGKPIPLNGEGAGLHRELLETVSDFSRRGLRCIAFSYRDLAALPVKKSEEEEKEAAANGQSGEEELITDSVLVGMVGLSDPLRPTSYRSVRLCQRAGVIVRMVTGDHVETARFISRECGIWTSKQHICMTGAEFRKMMADTSNEEQKKITVSRLRVLARSSPQDKQILVKYLQTQGHVVAATGDGTNDAPALKSADVGIAMFIAGTAVCKSAADLWLMDDNFSSIVAAVVWGRCVFDNIRKFLAFQLTVNCVALFLSLIGAITNFPLPLTTVQLLWINLIMDTAAAVALGTEQPRAAELLARSPKPLNGPLISPSMWYKILSQGAYQLALLLFVLYNYNLINDNTTADLEKPNSVKHKTLIFNIFTWCQIANSFNARRVNPAYNIFEGVFGNAYFLSIMFGAGCMQVLMVEAFGAFANTEHQTWDLWVIALIAGFWTIPMGFFYNFIWQNIFLRIKPEWREDNGVPLEEGAFDGAHLQDNRYSFKRPDNADEQSRLGRKSRNSFSHHHASPAGEGHAPAVSMGAPVAHPAPGAIGTGSSSRLMSSMSARRANPGGNSSARRSGGAVSFQPQGGAAGQTHDEHQPHGELEGAAPAAGASQAQISASASWPRGPAAAPEGDASKAPAKPQQAGGVQVIEEVDELF